MLHYYRVERNREKRYVVSIYYKNFLGALKEMHYSVHDAPKDVNAVIMYYKSRGYHLQSIATA